MVDEAMVRNLARRVLTRVGFEVVDAPDGLSALETFAREPDAFAFVLLDLTMPGLSGADTLTQLRDIRPSVRVILSSGYDRKSVAARFDDRPPAGFLEKPYTPAELIGVVREVLES